MLEVAQHRTWLESEFCSQQLASPTEGGEGVGRPTVAVQRQHQLTPGPLAERIGIEERFELADALLAGAARQLRLDRRLEHHRSQLPQPLHLACRKRGVGDVLVGVAAERGARLAQQADRITRVTLGDLGTGPGDKRRNPARVDVHAFRIELVSPAAMHDRRRAERPPKSQDRPLQSLACGRWPTSRPQRLLQDIDRHPSTEPGGEGGEERPLGGGQPDDRASLTHLDGAEDPNLHGRAKYPRRPAPSLRFPGSPY